MGFNSGFKGLKKPANGFDSNVGERSSYRQDLLRFILILFLYIILATITYLFSSCLLVKMLYNPFVAAALLHVLLIPSSLISSHQSYVYIWQKVNILKNITMQCPPACCYIISFGAQRLVLKDSPPLPRHNKRRPSLKPIWTNLSNISWDVSFWEGKLLD